MIQIAPLAHDQGAQVAHLDLPPDQADFVGQIADMLRETEPHIDFHVIREGEQAVGFFKIDRGMDRNEFAQPGELGLRGLLIGAQYQGRGLGKACFAQLPAYLAQIYPAAKSVVLTVNCRNSRAYHVYTKTGWHDDGTLYLGGRAGPQHVLRLSLR